MKPLFLPILLFLSLQTLHGQVQTIDWATDLEFIKRELPRKHYDLFSRLPEKEFNRQMDELIARSPLMTDYRVLDNLLQVLAQVGDTHTRLDLGPFNKASVLLPYGFYWFSDGIYITHSRISNTELLGHRIVSMNGYPMARVADSLSTLIPIDNSSTARNTLPRMLGFVPHLEYFGFSTGDSIVMLTEDLQGKLVRTVVDITSLTREKITSFIPDSMAYCWQNRQAFYTRAYFQDDKIFYVQYNRCWGKEAELIRGSRKRAREMPSFLKFQEEVFSQLESLPVEKVVFDLRFNGGGASHQGTQMIRKLAQDENLNKEGKLFVISGIHTFSSGLINLMDFRELTHATFVGEITAGKPNHYGEVRSMSLPVSGLRLSYSTKYFNEYSPDTDAFYPDVEIGTTFEDFRQGNDPPLNYIRSL